MIKDRKKKVPKRKQTPKDTPVIRKAVKKGDNSDQTGARQPDKTSTVVDSVSQFKPALMEFKVRQTHTDIC